MSDDSKYLVLGTAFGYQSRHVWPFVETLRQHYRGPVMLLVTSCQSERLVSYLRSRDITAVYFDCPYWMVMHVQLGRFVRYGEILRGCEAPYERVLLSDVYDVLFQGHPFDTAPSGELVCYLEHSGSTIGQSKMNSQWIEQLYGVEVLRLLMDKEISCGGTILGSHAGILDYIDRLLEHASPEAVARLPALRGHEQAIHNYLIHTAAFPHVKLSPNGEHTYTMGLVPDAEVVLGAGGAVLAPDGRRCPILHQYNYKPAVIEHLTAAFQNMPGLPDEV